MVGALELAVDDRGVGVALRRGSRLGALHEREQPLVLAADALTERLEVVLHPDELLRVANGPVVEMFVELAGAPPQRVDLLLQRGELGVDHSLVAAPAARFTAAALQLGIGRDLRLDVRETRPVVAEACVGLLEPEKVTAATHWATSTSWAVYSR